jgi:AcrR family transcriptional regulator
VDLSFHNGDACVMARPRAFEEDEALALAKDLFWERGYLTTSVGDLETATGLSRSSLYMAFGAKRDLFSAALSLYHETFIDPLLGPLERKGAGLQEIVGYFMILSELFAKPGADRGCLMINTIAECAGRDPAFTRQGAAFLDRVNAAFANAMKGAERSGAMSRGRAKQRATLLAGALVGAWMTVRADPRAAGALCLATAAQVKTWEE